MEDQLGSLGLVLNAVVLRTTRYIDAAVAQLRADGHEIRDEDIARLSPLKHKNLNVLGRYSFTAAIPVGGLRPLRDPDAVELDDDDEGTEAWLLRLTRSLPMVDAVLLAAVSMWVSKSRCRGGGAVWSRGSCGVW